MISIFSSGIAERRVILLGGSEINAFVFRCASVLLQQLQSMFQSDFIKVRLLNHSSTSRVFLILWMSEHLPDDE
jgi:hypothetical protein